MCLCMYSHVVKKKFKIHILVQQMCVAHIITATLHLVVFQKCHDAELFQIKFGIMIRKITVYLQLHRRGLFMQSRTSRSLHKPSATAVA